MTTNRRRLDDTWAARPEPVNAPIERAFNDLEHAIHDMILSSTKIDPDELIESVIADLRRRLNLDL